MACACCWMRCVDYLPSPARSPAVKGTVPKSKEEEPNASPNDNEPFSGLAFKTVSEKHGDLVFLRIYSGVLKPGDTIQNTVVGRAERISHIYRLFGDRRDRLEVAGAGRNRRRRRPEAHAHGHTLCARTSRSSLEEIRFPEPVISQSIIPDKNVDETKLADALGKLVGDDPTLQDQDRPRNQPAASSAAWANCTWKSRCISCSAIMASRSPPASRWSPIGKRWPSRSSSRHATSSNRAAAANSPSSTCATSRSPRIARRRSPPSWRKQGEKPDPNGIYFVDEDIRRGRAEGIYPLGRARLPHGCQKGAKYGFPVVDVQATLMDGKAHDVDSSADTFKLAAMESFRDAQSKAGLVILEPIMNVVVHAPSQYQGHWPATSTAAAARS